jgi:hypothetical protein
MEHFQRNLNQHEILRFLKPILNISKIFFPLSFLLTLKPNEDETEQENQNVFYKRVLEYNLATINGLGGLIL